MIFNIILTLFLVLLNGFFVAAEFSIVKVRSSQIDTKKGISKTVRRTTKSILHHLDSNLAATQLGITLASLGLGWVGEGLVAHLLTDLLQSLQVNLSETSIHSISIPLAFALITFMHIVFGELAPKSIAIRNPISTSLFIALPLKLFHTLFFPFIWSLNGVANIILKGIGIHPVNEAEVYTEEELKLIINESSEEGSIQETERNLIHKVFAFDNREVGDILVPRSELHSVDVNTPLEEIIPFMIQHGYSRYPVYQNNPDNIIGMIFIKDLLEIIQNKEKTSWVNQLRPPYFIPKNKKIKDLLKEMQTSKIQMAIVVNEYGSVMGIVTLEDILEELVGEIQDEYDEDEIPIVVKQSPERFIVNAQKPISDINNFLPFPLPESNLYNTVSGLFLEHFQNLPKEKDTFICGPYEVVVMKTNGKVVIQALLKLMDTN